VQADEVTLEGVGGWPHGTTVPDESAQTARVMSAPHRV